MVAVEKEAAESGRGSATASLSWLTAAATGCCVGAGDEEASQKCEVA